MNFQEIISLLGDQAKNLLEYNCKIVNKDLLHLPSKDCIDKIFINSNRNTKVLKSLSNIYNHGRLSKTGYLSILPVDQGIEHNAGYAFYKNKIYFDPENIMKLAIEGGCNAVATTFGNFGIIARKYAHKIPFIVKINHNESLTYPDIKDQIMYGSVEEAWNMGATAIGATIYFCSDKSAKQIKEIAIAFERAHELGLATVLWCYPRNKFLKTTSKDYHQSADITGQCNYMGVTIQADIIKQKLPVINHGFAELEFSKSQPEMYSKLCSSHVIDLCRYQVANCYLGRIGLLSSGGESSGENNKDLQNAIYSAIVNKRAGGVGLILGRKAFQKSLQEGIKILQSIQDVYLCDKITIA